MPTQLDWLKRTQSQIEGNLRERHELDEETRNFFIKSSFDTLLDLSWQTDVLRGRIQKLKADGMSAAQRKAWLKAMKELNELYAKIDKGKESYSAGKEYAERLPPLSHGINEQVGAINTLLRESGLYEEGGGKLAEGLGPEAVVMYSSAKLIADEVYLGGKLVLNDSELRQARAQYDNLRYQSDQIAERVNNAKADLAKFCAR